jgi:3-deoxy-7-phosphoheptulonate synthase
MRAYFEKPRTTVGWKGFLYDPDLDGSDDLVRGLARARKLMVELSELGVPLATEILDPLSAPYLDDTLSWVAIGARTSESQIHRQLASQLPCPVGFKNGTDGNIRIASDAISSALAEHSHLGLDEEGRVALMRSFGNSACHLVLRGGEKGPNFSKAQVEGAAQSLKARGHKPRILIDCSHQNSGKDHRRQPEVARAAMAQLGAAHADVMGIMLESHLQSGRQDVATSLRYGVSVTDACIDFATTEHLLEELAMKGKTIA